MRVYMYVVGAGTPKGAVTSTSNIITVVSTRLMSVQTLSYQFRL